MAAFIRGRKPPFACWQPATSAIERREASNAGQKTHTPTELKLLSGHLWAHAGKDGLRPAQHGASDQTLAHSFRSRIDRGEGGKDLRPSAIGARSAKVGKRLCRPRPRAGFVWATSAFALTPSSLDIALGITAVSYTHLTLPTTERV